MKTAIHPNYVECTVTCGCGETFTTRSTREKIQIEICSACHPFYTGKQKFVDAAGRVEKFQKKFGWSKDKASEATTKKSAKSDDKGGKDDPSRKAMSEQLEDAEKVAKNRFKPKYAANIKGPKGASEDEAKEDAPKAEEKPVKEPKAEETPKAEAPKEETPKSKDTPEKDAS